MTAETFDATKCATCGTYTEDPDGQGNCPACAGTGGDFDCCVPARRGTTNGNARGNTEDRRRRREWLVRTYRANRDLLTFEPGRGRVVDDTAGREVYRVALIGVTLDVAVGEGEAACRCYRCGTLLTVETVTVDRITPGVMGGTYRRNNIRPACAGCNSETGGALASRPRAVRRG